MSRGGGSLLKVKTMRRAVMMQEVKREGFITISESTKRQFALFIPFCAVLAVVVCIFSLLIQLVYLQPLQTGIEDSIWTNYQTYLKSYEIGDKITLILSYQRVVTPLQTMSNFLRTLIQNNVAMQDLVTWSADSTGSYTYRQMTATQQNFRNTNDMTARDLCPFDTFYSNKQDSSTIQQYKRRQYFGWANWQQNYWENLSEEQRQYLIKVDTAMSVNKVVYYNQVFEGIQKYSYYSARNSDDTWYGFHPGERLLSAGKFYNSKQFGGPFSCTKQADGSYLEYKLPYSNYYVGTDQNHSTCPKDNLGNCQCSYYQQARGFPIVWRCRPWYIASIQNSYITFADAYADVNTGNLITTCSFKLVIDSSTTTLDEEDKLPAYMVQSVDLTLNNLTSIYGQGDISEEYSYLVAPLTFNYDNNYGYYNYTAFYHPLLNGTKMTIFDLEFLNSTNRAEEVSEYKSKTTFMMNPTIRQDGCNLFTSSSSGTDNESSTSSSSTNSTGDYAVYINKNGSSFYTLFSTIEVCYGNLQQQKSLTVGYLARAISVNRKYQITETIRNYLGQMQIAIILSLVGSFFLIFIILFLLLRQLLKYNFEEPISILTRVIMESGPQEIHLLHNAIEKGEIRTQLELKNLLSAINTVVIQVQTKVQDDLNNSKTDEDQQVILFKSALKTFQTVEHKLGMGLCLNNIGNVYMRKGDFKTALSLYKSAFLLSQDQYREELKNKSDTDRNNHEFLITDATKRNFMRIYACRKYQIGCTLLKAVLHQIQLSEANEQQIQQFTSHENNNILNHKEINGTDRILSDDETKTEFNNLLKLPAGVVDQLHFIPEISTPTNSAKHILKHSSTQNFDAADKQKSVNKLPPKGKERFLRSKTELNQDEKEDKEDNLATTRSKNREGKKKQSKMAEKRKSMLHQLFGLDKNKEAKEAKQADLADNKNNFVDHYSDSDLKESGSESGLSKENVFSDRYYKRVQNKVNNSEENHMLPTPKGNNSFSFSDKNSYLMQAYDLFFDVKSIFDKLGDYCQQNQYHEAYEYYSLSILNLIKLAHCQLLLGSRNFIVKELLQQSKSEIQLKIRRFDTCYSNTLHQDILIEKYYLLKAQLRVLEENYPKALKNVLKCLNYNLRNSVLNDADRSYSKYSDGRQHFYDPLDTLLCLDLIKFITQKERISFQPYQKQYLEYDYTKLKQQSQDISEPYFFEVFFREAQPSTMHQIEITLS